MFHVKVECTYHDDICCVWERYWYKCDHFSFSRAGQWSEIVTWGSLRPRVEETCGVCVSVCMCVHACAHVCVHMHVHTCTCLVCMKDFWANRSRKSISLKFCSLFVSKLHILLKLIAVLISHMTYCVQITVLLQSIKQTLKKVRKPVK
jgi:hypothetical protein